MLLKTPLTSLKKNLHLHKFVRALYYEAFSVQIVKNPYHDFFFQTLQRRHAWPILQHDNKVRQQKVKNGQSKSQEKYVRNKNFFTFFKKRVLTELQCHCFLLESFLFQLSFFHELLLVVLLFSHYLLDFDFRTMHTEFENTAAST